ncbi:MAG: heavy-metal-associated domain-containing protein [Candidatus Obscuribacterales bacterium]|nr:heavy-metal-associated domain-containing protein [Candidatus Obscuribacterales bacterium]
MKTSLISQSILILTLLSLPTNTPWLTSSTAWSKPAAESSAKGQKLRRADFRVTGASCVSCLRRVGTKMREQKGVLKADVSIFKPYWGIVIYDSNTVNLNKIYDSVKDEKIKFEDIEDKPIANIPFIVIPKGLAKDSSPVSSKPAFHD